MKTIAITIDEQTLQRLDRLVAVESASWKSRSEIVRQAVQEFVARLERMGEEERVDEGEVHEDSSFVDDLKADSLDLVELIMAFEEEFSSDGTPVEISDEDAANIHRIDDAVAYLKDHGVQDT